MAYSSSLKASDRARVLESRYRAQDFPSLHSIFEELLRADSPEVRKGSNQPHHIVQTLVALDRPGLILSLLTQWTLPAGPTLIAPPQLLRFAAHMGLFLHALGRTGNVMDGDPADLPSADGIIIAYIRHLISTQQKKQVALYTSKLQLERQVGTYAAFLRDIVDHKERQECLELARLHGLDVHLITQCVVRLATSEQKSGNLHKESSPGISQEDNERIAALEWLMFNPSQIAHALRHSNTLTRRFILEKKPIAARKVQTSLPSNAVALAKQFWSKKTWVDNAIKEHLSLSTYLAAVSAYDSWVHIFYKQPRPPPPLPAGSLTSQEIVWVKQQAEFQLAYGQWKEKAVKKADEALKALFAVLTFPLGWLKDEPTAFSSTNLSRDNELKKLRRMCVPEIFLLCHTVLHETQQYQDCLELASMIADEQQTLYKDFSSEELREFLSLLGKSAMAALAG